MSSGTVLHIAYGLDIGGLERVMINTINGLPEFEHKILVLTRFSEKFKGLLPEYVDIVAMQKNSGHDWAIYKDIYQQIKRINPSVVHSYNLATFEYQVCAFAAGIKTRIHAEHGRDIFDPDGSNKKYQLLRRLLAPFVHNVVSVSQDLHLWLQNTVRLNKNKTKLIYNGIDSDFYRPGEKTYLDQTQNGKFVFGCVGRLAEIKDHMMLIQAFDHACKLNPKFAQKCQLTLVGDGDQKTKLESKLAELDNKQNIVLAGEHIDMKTVYLSFDIFVLSSLAEGIPMTILEALACGKPVLSTEVGGVPEIIESNKQGILVNSHDYKDFAKALIDIYDNRDLESMKEQARELAVQKFSEASMLKAYKSIYYQGK